jgi:hypothetical protein
VFFCALFDHDYLLTARSVPPLRRIDEALDPDFVRLEVAKFYRSHRADSFFKARAKRPYLGHTGRASNAEKQPTGPGPEGCDENGPAAALLVGHVSIQICSLYCQSGSDRLADGPF